MPSPTPTVMPPYAMGKHADCPEGGDVIFHFAPKIHRECSGCKAVGYPDADGPLCGIMTQGEKVAREKRIVAEELERATNVSPTRKAVRKGIEERSAKRQPAAAPVVQQRRYTLPLPGSKR